MVLASALALSLALPLILTLLSQGTEGPFASAFAGAICGSPEMYSSAVPGATAWHLPRSWRSADMMLSYPHGIHCELGLFRVWKWHGVPICWQDSDIDLCSLPFISRGVRLKLTTLTTTRMPSPCAMRNASNVRLGTNLEEFGNPNNQFR